MALLLDSRTLPASERIAATNAALSSTEIPAILRYDTSRGPVGHRLDYWDLGPGTHVTQIMGSGLRVTRGRSNCARRPRNASALAFIGVLSRPSRIAAPTSFWSPGTSP